MAEYPVLCRISKPYSINVCVQDAEQFGPYRRGMFLVEFQRMIDTDRLCKVLEEAALGDADNVLGRFAVDDFGRLRMRRDGYGVEITAYLEDDENPDDVYQRISTALAPHGWVLT
jgi:hypothetical protein